MIDRYQTPEMAAIWGPEAKARTWFDVEIAICRANEKLGNIPPGQTDAIEKNASFDLARMAELEKETRHDLMAFVRNMAETAGGPGKYIHYGVTSYDVIDTALALMLRASVDQLLRSSKELRFEVARLAREHARTPMIGRTHGIHAEPITFGFKLAGWHAELLRNEARLTACREEISVGKVSGPVGVHGVGGPKVEEEVCRILDLKPDPASTQIVARDRHASLINAVAVLGASLERFATELRNLQRTEILEVQEAFGSGQTGSSAMPHKRNPWNSETVCGLARILRGNAQAMMESVATWHERDLTNSSVERIVFPDTFHLADFMLKRLTAILRGLQVFPERMMKNLRRMGDLVFSEHVMVGLVSKGMAREDAYKVAQRNASKAWDGADFRSSIESDPDVSSRLSAKEIDECFDLSHHLRFVEHTLQAAGITN
ncbi:MAG TPA: adenylosuccinate lyase [Fimbriimonadales bacterium]|nr:adenylosuccinate lyase [Fimbriimonadales bacterium]